jgi:hypothetical protein
MAKCLLSCPVTLAVEGWGLLEKGWEKVRAVAKASFVLRPG